MFSYNTSYHTGIYDLNFIRKKNLFLKHFIHKFPCHTRLLQLHINHYAKQLRNYLFIIYTLNVTSLLFPDFLFPNLSMHL